LSFDVPVVPVEDHVYALELFHGPTMAFKDFGARFMSQLLGYFARQQEREIVILVATSGDTGSAVANGFLDVPGTRVVVLYPSGKVSDIQEKQFTTLGSNITALEVAGTFDDCQRLVKTAFLDAELKRQFFLTSANSINIARLIPQSFYFFYAYAKLAGLGKPVVFCVPSGNFGNITGGLLAQRMGLPIGHFIAATNINDVVPEFLRTHELKPRPSKTTISNAMDVGSPSNIVRMLDLFGGDVAALEKAVTGYAFSDADTQQAMRDVFKASGYVMDPHGAVGYLGLKKYLREVRSDVTGVFLETAHPAKFKEVVEETLGEQVEIPATLQKFLTRTKQSRKMSSDFGDLKEFLTAEF
ncbi:MAG TPA: threonine synthase, partial [Chryseolinea sp.]|nr:threonine synthase [Chryseolinea sp.]